MRFTLAVLAAVVTAGCTSADPYATVAGCYALRAVQRPGPDAGANLVALSDLNMPAHIELTTRLGEVGFEAGKHLLRESPRERPSRSAAYWTTDRHARGLELLWTNGFYGASANLLRTGRSTFAGYATSFSDYPEKPLSRDIVAEREPCSGK
jgi:hypothetical protein